MARPLRIQGENCLYHISSRGDNRKRIFADGSDYCKFLKYLRLAKQHYRCWIYAYCLMSNHYHLLLETSQANLSQVMHYLNGSYTVYFNRKRKTCGHLFQGRYKSILVEKDSYLLELTRYIHLNPVRAKIVDSPENYKWSSYQSYVVAAARDLIDWEKLHAYIGMTAADYRRFVADGMGMRFSPFSEVRAGMVLGSESFVEEQLKKIEPLRNKAEVSNRRQIENRRDIPALMARAADLLKMPVDDLRRRQRSCIARKVAIYVLRKCSGGTNQQLGDYFNISFSAVSKACADVESLIGQDNECRELVERVISSFKG
ncbi:MAG: transposase [Candidatus Omnitrophica bacterium]|nr:transposase [Candidatus Omnitrophota bacterium]